MILLYRWSGEAMVPLGRFAKEARSLFDAGETYRLETVEERSRQSHDHYFACIRDAWLTLPEAQYKRFPTEEHLRKYALIKCGFADQRTVVCASKAEAQRWAAFIKPMDSFAIVMATGCVVTVWTAQSQKLRAMGKKKFQESKRAVLDYLADFLGAKAKDLGEAA
jgi:hypothetical protein